jgi:hypothetical protein
MTAVTVATDANADAAAAVNPLVNPLGEHELARTWRALARHNIASISSPEPLTAATAATDASSGHMIIPCIKISWFDELWGSPGKSNTEGQ